MPGRPGNVRVNAAEPTSDGRYVTSGSEWQERVGQSWAKEWQRTDRSFGELTPLLLRAAVAKPYDTALDIGCGAGELTFRLARANPGAGHLGIDISEDLLRVAGERLSALPNADVELVDASVWRPLDGFAPDLLVSRHGVMFFQEPAAAFANLLGQARTDARLVFSCFRTREENEWVRELAAVLPSGGEGTDGRAPGPFAFGEKDYVGAILQDAGWRSIEFASIDYAMIAGQGADPVADALSYFRTIGPVARQLAGMEGGEREAAINTLAEMLESHRNGDTVSLPAACWIVSARSGD